MKKLTGVTKRTGKTREPLKRIPDEVRRPKFDLAGEIGVKIIDYLKRDVGSCKTFFQQNMTRMRVQYPTNSHVNKFIVGLSCEYLFCHALRMANVPIYLCTDDAVRNDVFANMSFANNAQKNMKTSNNAVEAAGGNVRVGYSEFSLKYKSPTNSRGTFTIPNVRLVNTQGSGFNMANLKEDVFLIVPNPDTNPANPHKGMIIFISHTLFNNDDLFDGIQALIKRSDGVDLNSKWIAAFVNDPAFDDCKVNVDISSKLPGAEELDSIRILTEAALGHRLDPGIFLCRNARARTKVPVTKKGRR